MLNTEPLNIHFTIPAKDHLGREEVQGQLRFHAEHIDLHWRMTGNVFTKGPSEMKLVAIPYPAVAEVSLKKRWLRPTELILRLENPELVSEIPGIEVGRMVLIIDAQSKKAIEKVNDLIDFQRSVFLLDETNKRLDAMRAES
ncbi:hypothetical protein [Roseibacillus persicicus]|uniref:Uncharacterized protein n=1 Tax=Roseibacillus persicicus TaxID=454148 RepID=A0A918TS22_9BACT|nr:hypothetical protein [Roseibacillus persicicus]MDQ8189584.1 hypothetical protein [Roseibacillus persicicus]GHC59586.1 hypothetical protein GCM10007100_28490 [Roseibacillus persicicus]